jgi:hypothetical protein
MFDRVQLHFVDRDGSRSCQGRPSHAAAKGRGMLNTGGSIAVTQGSGRHHQCSARSVCLDSMVAEGLHKAGERGVLLAKQWLESTTHVEVPFSVYDDPAQTALLRLDDEQKRYDLSGYFLENRRPLSVEVKNYTAVGNQPAEYTEYLANAYSVTARDLGYDLDVRREFMWVTWHPFSQTKWTRLTSRDEIRSALDEHPDVLGAAEVDEAIVELVSGRLWLVVLNPRQDQLLLTRDELYKVWHALKRKGS